MFTRFLGAPAVFDDCYCEEGSSDLLRCVLSPELICSRACEEWRNDQLVLYGLVAHELFP